MIIKTEDWFGDKILIGEVFSKSRTVLCIIVRVKNIYNIVKRLVAAIAYEVGGMDCNISKAGCVELISEEIIDKVIVNLTVTEAIKLVI